MTRIKVFCPVCGKNPATTDRILGVLPCKKCNKLRENNNKPLIPMTEWQKKKIGFYRNGKSWLKDIENRVVLENGDIGVLGKDGNLKEVRPKDGKYYGRSES